MNKKASRIVSSIACDYKWIQCIIPKHTHAVVNETSKSVVYFGIRSQYTKRQQE